ncbi:MAG: hypothetical protein LBT40_00960 [Deltaproteobacteria bacterium]|nr:hypothetical protein [Deltaproteobacteria bacterium]
MLIDTARSFGETRLAWSLMRDKIGAENRNAFFIHFMTDIYALCSLYPVLLFRIEITFMALADRGEIFEHVLLVFKERYLEQYGDVISCDDMKYFS